MLRDNNETARKTNIAVTIVAVIVGVAAIIWIGNHVYLGCTDFFGFFKSCTVTTVR